MLYVTLICSDEACAEEFEALAELEQLDDLLCEGCSCLLQPIAFAAVAETVPVIRLHRPASPHQLRRAA